jgi:hypothetical protein
MFQIFLIWDVLLVFLVLLAFLVLLVFLVIRGLLGLLDSFRVRLSFLVLLVLFGLLVLLVFLVFFGIWWKCPPPNKTKSAKKRNARLSD